MRKILLASLLALPLPLRSTAAQAQIQVHVALPTIRFEAAPPLVVVSPGVQVVPEYDEEVFFVDGWYWYRNDGAWFRSRDHRGHWVAVPAGRVPPRLVRIPPGQYRHHRAQEMRHEEKEMRREVKEVRHERAHEEHERERGEREEHHGRGGGHGRGHDN
jgi:hypothetical protein